MKRRRVVWIMASGGMLLVVAALLFISGSEPRYQGRGLSEWLEICQKIKGERRIVEANWEDARQALFHIGTNAIPSLLKRVGYERPAWQSNLLSFCQNWPRVPGTKGCIKWIEKKRGPGYVQAGVTGFGVLGRIAAPAVPVLEQWAGDNSHPARSMRAYWALREIETNALPLARCGPNSVITVLPADSGSK